MLKGWVGYLRAGLGATFCPQRRHGDVAAACCDPHSRRQGALWPHGCTLAHLPVVCRRPLAKLSPMERSLLGYRATRCSPRPQRRHHRQSLAQGEARRRSSALPVASVCSSSRWRCLLPGGPSATGLLVSGCVLRVSGLWNWMCPPYTGPFPCPSELASLFPPCRPPPSLSFFLAAGSAEECGFELGFLLFRGDALLCAAASSCCPRSFSLDTPTGAFGLVYPEPNLALFPRSLPLLQRPFQPPSPEKGQNLGASESPRNGAALC